MKKPNEILTRDARSDRIRLIGLAIILAAVFVLEWTVGKSARDVAGIKSIEQLNTSNWARANYSDYTDTVPIPGKSPEVKRIVYLSNSHAFTGGKIANHLQAMLNNLNPDGYEILDMSDAGIFIPDMLQRTISVLNHDIDALLLSLGYISFSDRMKLSMQSHSARSFFKPEITQQLRPGFWLRNYEISLYFDTMFAHGFDLYRYRNEIRDQWEKPLANWLRNRTEPRVIHSIELDASQSWRFPDGYDRNLFQWRLYRAGRSNHMADLRDLLDIVAEHGVKVLASNLPVDWKKSAYPDDPEDTSKYQRELAEIFAGQSDYQDYENTFPKAFTTYDALHPTWHGARLHAFDLLLRLRDAGLIKASDDVLLTAFNESDTQKYQSISKYNFRPLQAAELQRFRRFDISERDNAINLLRRIISFSPASDEDIGLLWSLAQRIEYWRKVGDQLNLTLSSDENTQIWEGLQVQDEPLWRAAVHAELEKSRKNTEMFTQILKSIQSQRTIQFPVLEPNLATLVTTRNILAGDMSLLSYNYRFDDGTRLEIFKNFEGRAIYMDVFPTSGLAYRRVDILGDGSFIAMVSPTASFSIPPWLWPDKDVRRLGI